MRPPAAPSASPPVTPTSCGSTGRILIVSPCRNEQEYLRRTLDTVLAQTCRPACWVVVDDGSSDATPAILSEYASANPGLRVVRREDRGRRSVGPGVVDAFYAGLEIVDLDEFEFVCKLDMDLELPVTYFEEMVARMRAEPRLGSCSGKPYYEDASGQLRPEWCDDEMVVGMIKFYRVECFRQIGGFVREVMWDGIDSHRCRMLGWLARSWDDPKLRFKHLRPMGASDRSILLGRRRHGYGQYFMGSSASYLLASVLRRLMQPPYILGSLNIFFGYFWAMLTLKPRYQDREFRRFLRRYQWSALLRGKSAAVSRLDQSGASRWREQRHSGS